MESGPPETPMHVHRLPGSVRAAVFGLSAAVLLLAVALGLMAVYVYQAHQYVQGRGQYRDAQAARIEQAATEEVRQAACDILGEFPAGDARADRLRVRYDCPIPGSFP